MTQLQMERAAHAAGAETRTIALYKTSIFDAPGLSPLILAAAISGLMWTLTIARALRFFA